MSMSQASPFHEYDGCICRYTYIYKPLILKIMMGTQRIKHIKDFIWCRYKRDGRMRLMVIMGIILVVWDFSDRHDLTIREHIKYSQFPYRHITGLIRLVIK